MSIGAHHAVAGRARGSVSHSPALTLARRQLVWRVRVLAAVGALVLLGIIRLVRSTGRLGIVALRDLDRGVDAAFRLVARGVGRVVVALGDALRPVVVGLAFVLRPLRTMLARLLVPVLGVLRPVCVVAARVLRRLGRALSGVLVAAGMRLGGVAQAFPAPLRAGLRALARMLHRGWRLVTSFAALALAVVAAFLWFTPNSASSPATAAAPGGLSHGVAGMSHLAYLMRPKHFHPLAPALSTPRPAPPSVADAPPLRPHEVFGFAPYWELPVSGGFDVADLTTMAYFSVDVNPDGTLNESGAGWNGLESQDFTDLVNRAHAAGDRVVLTVGDFTQSSLDQLTSDPSAPARLSQAILGILQTKHLDGVNLDLEGQGSGDQVGLTRLVQGVSTALHAANPHYQLTMDTYASSAGDPGGFYDIRSLAPWVDAFFVMEYEYNLQSGTSLLSPITSQEFSDLQTLEQYTAAVPASKVLMGVPFYGEDWPTTNGTQTATATGAPQALTYAAIKSSGHPVYWDAVTDTPWTSYLSGTQWHQQHFEDPTSIFMETQLSERFGVAGMGIWALGMDGNDPAMMAAITGNAPVQKDALAGPIGAVPSSGLPQATSPTIPPSTSSTIPPPSTSSTPPGGTAPPGTGTNPGTGTTPCQVRAPSSWPAGMVASGCWRAGGTSATNPVPEPALYLARPSLLSQLPSGSVSGDLIRLALNGALLSPLIDTPANPAGQVLACLLAWQLQTKQPSLVIPVWGVPGPGGEPSAFVIKLHTLIDHGIARSCLTPLSASAPLASAPFVELSTQAPPPTPTTTTTAPPSSTTSAPPSTTSTSASTTSIPVTSTSTAPPTTTTTQP